VATESLGGDLAAISHTPEPSGEENGVAVGNSLLDLVVPAGPVPERISEHVLAALHYLDLNLNGRPTLSEAAAAGHISPSRLTHLFTDEVGIPFRSYVLWLRLRRVAEMVADGSNLTEAAISSGFSDSSHLSRVFKDNFGLAPSALLRMEVTDTGWPS